MNRTIRSVAATLAALVLSAPLGVAAEAATLVADAYTNSAKPTKNFNDQKLLRVQGPPASTAVQKTFLQFDLSALPSGTVGSDVVKATLTVGVENVTNAGSFDVFRVTGAWTEAGITAATAPTLGGSPEVTGVALALAD